MKRFLQITFGLIMFLGFFILFGTVGASDTETITLNRALIQSVIGLVILGIGVVGVKVTNWYYV
jgi:hypothetical protein